jgi:hypothetical protein
MGGIVQDEEFVDGMAVATRPIERADYRNAHFLLSTKYAVH